MNAQQFMEDLDKRLREESNLDPEILALVTARLFKPERERNVSEALEAQMESIAMRRASKGAK